VFGGDAPSVGASGAIFGLFGILITAERLHHPVDRQSRGIVRQLLFIVVLNVVIDFAPGSNIDVAAHLGGLTAGLWLGALVPPTAVPTMSSLWHLPGETRAAVGRAAAPSYVMAVGVAVVGVAVVAGVVVGTTARAAFTEPPVPAARIAYVSAAPTRGAATTVGRGSATAVSVER
jgi:hypothetical protein